MLNFAVGPVQIKKEIRDIGAEPVPFFRTDDFAKIMYENEKLMLKFSKAGEGSRAVFVTGSGTSSMEASVINTLTKDDKALVVNGGRFGFRFTQILSVHNIPYTEIKLEIGQTLTKVMLEKYSGQGYTAFIVNIHETSTGVLYDLDMISEFCKKNSLFLIVDAVSSLFADQIDMGKAGIDILITASQKALACHPGISIIVMSPKALDRINKIECGSFYLDLKAMIKNQDKGVTPFTVAVTIIRQINYKLNEIERNGGVDKEVERTSNLAKYFRERIKELPFDLVAETPSNAATSLHPRNVSAYSIFEILKDQYGIWVAPNTGDMKDYVFRVGHIGDLCEKDYDILLNAFKDMHSKGLL